jgi:hypothetical protein
MWFMQRYNCKTMVEYSMMGKQMFMMNREVVSWPSAVSDNKKKKKKNTLQNFRTFV